jgi:hypothetical protein
MHGSRQGARLHGMLDQREPFLRVILIDEESGIGSSQFGERTIIRADYPWRRHASSSSNPLVRARLRPTRSHGEDRRAGGDLAELASRKFRRHLNRSVRRVLAR